MLRSRMRMRGGSGGAWYQQGKADGVDPSLWADFVNNRYAVNGVEAPFADVFTYTRASTATYFDASGVLQTASANTPRFDYDPITLQPKGILIEEQRTNLLLRSSEFDNGTWLQEGVTVLPNTSLAPDGSLSADAISVNTVSTFRKVIQNFSATSGTYTFSTYIKAGSTSSAVLYVAGFSIASASVISGPGSAGATGSSGGCAFSGLSSSQWSRISVTFTATGAGTTQYNIYPGNSNSQLSGDSIYVWGAQLEVGAFPTSYIPTTTAAVTRSGDSILNSSANAVPFASWYNQTEGCFNPEFTYIGQSAGAYPQMMFAIDNTQNNRIGILVDDSGTPKVSFQSYVSNAYQGIGTGALDPTGILLKAAGAYKNNDGAISFNGLGAVSDATFGIPTVDRLNINISTSSACFYMRQARYYPIRVTNSELARITT